MDAGADEDAPNIFAEHLDTKTAKDKAQGEKKRTSKKREEMQQEDDDKHGGFDDATKKTLAVMKSVVPKADTPLVRYGGKETMTPQGVMTERAFGGFAPAIAVGAMMAKMSVPEQKMYMAQCTTVMDETGHSMLQIAEMRGKPKKVALDNLRASMNRHKTAFLTPLQNAGYFSVQDEAQKADRLDEHNHPSHMMQRDATLVLMTASEGLKKMRVDRMLLEGGYASNGEEEVEGGDDKKPQDHLSWMSITFRNNMKMNMHMNLVEGRGSSSRNAAKTEFEVNMQTFMDNFWAAYGSDKEIMEKGYNITMVQWLEIKEMFLKFKEENGNKCASHKKVLSTIRALGLALEKEEKEKLDAARDKKKQEKVEAAKIEKQEKAEAARIKKVAQEQAAKDRLAAQEQAVKDRLAAKDKKKARQDKDSEGEEEVAMQAEEELLTKQAGGYIAVQEQKKQEQKKRKLTDGSSSKAGVVEPESSVERAQRKMEKAKAKMEELKAAFKLAKRKAIEDDSEDDDSEELVASTTTKVDANGKEVLDAAEFWKGQYPEGPPPRAALPNIPKRKSVVQPVEEAVVADSTAAIEELEEVMEAGPEEPGMEVDEEQGPMNVQEHLLGQTARAIEEHVLDQEPQQSMDDMYMGTTGEIGGC